MKEIQPPRVPAPRPPRPVQVPFTVGELLRDHWVWPPAVVALVVNAGLLVFVWFQSNTMGEQLGIATPLVPMHFDSNGQPDRVDPVSALYALPLIGLIVLSINVLLGALIYRRERVASYLLILAANLVQVFLWAAIISILRALV
ncbi:MAG TPA: hypothetical protein VIX58_06625 [Anaerolineae bacterium]